METGTYFTPDPEDASRWAVGLSNDAQSVAGANVMPVKVAPGRQRVIDNTGGYDDASVGYSPLRHAQAAWTSRLLGYDSVLFKNIDEGYGPIDQLLMLNPGKRVRSVFDPVDPKTAGAATSLGDLLLQGTGAGQTQLPVIDAATGAPEGWQVY